LDHHVSTKDTMPLPVVVATLLDTFSFWSTLFRWNVLTVLFWGLSPECCDARLLERVRTLKRSLESVDALAMDTVIKRYLGSRRNRNRRDGLRRHSAHFSSVSRDKQRF